MSITLLGNSWIIRLILVCWINTYSQMLVSLAQHKEWKQRETASLPLSKGLEKAALMLNNLQVISSICGGNALFNSFHISPVYEKLKFTKCFNVHIKLFSLYSGMKGPGGMLKII